MSNHFNIPKGRSRNRVNWCGPYALAVIFGSSYDHADLIVRKATGKTMVKGLWLSEMRAAINDRNNGVQRKLAVVRHDVTDFRGAGHTGRAKHMTMTQWYKQRPNKTATYLVMVTGHFLIVRGTKVIDNHSRKWEPFHARRTMKRSHVKGVYEIQRVAA